MWIRYIYICNTLAYLSVSVCIRTCMHLRTCKIHPFLLYMVVGMCVHVVCVHTRMYLHAYPATYVCNQTHGHGKYPPTSSKAFANAYVHMHTHSHRNVPWHKHKQACTHVGYCRTPTPTPQSNAMPQGTSITKHVQAPKH